MGGSGSTRWGGHRRHRTEREACAIGTAYIKPMLRDWLETSCSYQASNRRRTVLGATLIVGRMMRDPAGGLTRTLTIDYDERPAWKDQIRLSSVPGRFGGLVWFLHCPACDRRARVLYIRVADNFWHAELSQPARCRQCCGLRYHSQRCSPEQRGDLMVMRAARRINPATRTLAEDLAAPPEKPKRMRWTTYDRLCVRFDDAVKERDGVYLAGAARFLWRIMPRMERERWAVTRDLMQAGGQ